MSELGDERQRNVLDKELAQLVGNLERRQQRSTQRAEDFPVTTGTRSEVKLLDPVSPALSVQGWIARRGT